MNNVEKILECMKEISENIASGMFMIDEETMDEMLECGARKYEIDELEIALDKAIEWIALDYLLRKKANKGDKNEWVKSKCRAVWRV